MTPASFTQVSHVTQVTLVLGTFSRSDNPVVLVLGLGPCAPVATVTCHPSSGASLRVVAQRVSHGFLGVRLGTRQPSLHTLTRSWWDVPGIPDGSEWQPPSSRSFFPLAGCLNGCAEALANPFSGLVRGGFSVSGLKSTR